MSSESMTRRLCYRISWAVNCHQAV